MKKSTILLTVIVVAAFLVATALGLQNSTIPESQNNVPEPPESARNAAINYILQAHIEVGALQVPSSWEMQNLTPDLLGASTLQYTENGWNVTVSYPVVLEPMYTVIVEYTGNVSFQWAGTVTQDWNVTETTFTII